MSANLSHEAPAASGLRVHFFQHIEGEGVGSPEQWLQQSGAIVTQTEFFKAGKTVPDLPAHDSVDLLIIMGGAMSVNDEAEYPWLVAEKDWIREHIAAGRALSACVWAAS